MKVPDHLEPTVQETLNIENNTARMNEVLLPAAILGAKLSKDGNQWCVLLGDDLQSGVAGFGDTPYHAYSEFYRSFTEEKINV